MIEIINELLDLVRIDDRRGQDFDFIVLDAGELVREVVADFGVPEGHSAAVVEGSPLPLSVRADRRKLSQAVRNIVSNAYKYSPDGGEVAVQLVAADSSSKGQAPLVGIEVADHGLGMTAEQVARVFERFYRADNSGTIPGTGLGMSIVKEIMGLHGGDVTVVSQPGLGTTVTLWLPMAKASAQVPTRTEVEAEV
jgi:signal transduction histidine kinase